jgi:hypothetical protein
MASGILPILDPEEPQRDLYESSYKFYILYESFMRKFPRMGAVCVCARMCMYVPLHKYEGK